MQIIPNGTINCFPTEHYARLFYIGCLLFIHSKTFLQEQRSVQWSMAETLKTVNNVRMMITNKLAVLIFTLHQVEGIKNYIQKNKKQKQKQP